MIRYVLAALLTVALLSVTGLALDQTASDNTERELRAGITALEDAGIDLRENEELSPEDHPNPQRVVELEMPADSLTTEGVSQFEVEPVNGTDVSFVRYVLDDGTTHRAIVDERIVYRDATENRSTEIRGSGRQTVTLVLLPDAEGDPVVVADPPEEELYPPGRE